MAKKGKKQVKAKKKPKTKVVAKNPVGRPRVFKSPDEMQIAIDSYFAENNKPTVCGLALHLGFISRQSFFDYEGYGKEFSDTIKKAKARIEQALESHLYGNSVTGTIFNLKNNFGWHDKQELEHSGELKLLPPNIG